MIGSYARRLWDHDYPWGPTREERDRFCRTIIDEWGGPVGIDERAPSMAHDPAFRDWWASYLRMGASPGAAVALTRMNAEIDIRDVLPSIRVPTLVLHRTGDRLLKVEEGRYLASRIPGATLVELPGDDHLPFVGDQDAMLDAIDTLPVAHARTREPAERARLGARRSPPMRSRRDLALLKTVFAREVSFDRGLVALQSRRRGSVATFDGPGRAVHVRCRSSSIARQSRIPARAGVHIGECDPAAPEGPVMEVSAGLAESADPHAVNVSRTLADLLPGCGVMFEDSTNTNARTVRTVP